MRRALVIAIGLIAAGGLFVALRPRSDAARNRDLGLVAAGGAQETRVSLQALASAGPIVTVVGEINYDAARLRMKNCTAQAPEKTLHVKESTPGTVRAVLAGSLKPLPPSSDVMTCTFAVTGGGGSTVVRAHGEVADTSFVDRPFVLEQTVQIGS